MRQSQIVAGTRLHLKVAVILARVYGTVRYRVIKLPSVDIVMVCVMMCYEDVIRRRNVKLKRTRCMHCTGPEGFVYVGAEQAMPPVVCDYCYNIMAAIKASVAAENERAFEDGMAAIWQRMEMWRIARTERPTLHGDGW